MKITKQGILQENDVNDDLFEAIANVGRIATNLDITPAIWLDPLEPMLSVLRAGSIKRTRRIVKGDMIRVSANGLLDDVIPDNDCPATHLILECRATVYGTLPELVVEELESEKTMIIKL